MNKTVIGLIVFGLLAGAIAWVVLGMDSEPESQTPTNQQEEQSATNQDEVPVNTQQPQLTAEEVSTHNNKDDCWTIIEDKVYDITEFIPLHPGGEEVLRACGIDSTTLFTTRHTEDGEPVGSGTPHSPEAESRLEEYLLGPLQ